MSIEIPSSIGVGAYVTGERAREVLPNGTRLRYIYPGLPGPELIRTLTSEATDGFSPEHRGVAGHATYEVISLPDQHPSAHDLGLRNGVDDSCVHGRSAWSCVQCDAGQVAELVALWGRDRNAAASCRRSVRMVWPELAERLDNLLDQQDGGGKR